MKKLSLMVFCIFMSLGGGGQQVWGMEDLRTEEVECIFRPNIASEILSRRIDDGSTLYYLPFDVWEEQKTILKSFLKSWVRALPKQKAKALDVNLVGIPAVQKAFHTLPVIEQEDSLKQYALIEYLNMTFKDAAFEEKNPHITIKDAAFEEKSLHVALLCLACGSFNADVHLSGRTALDGGKANLRYYLRAVVAKSFGLMLGAVEGTPKKEERLQQHYSSFVNGLSFSPGPKKEDVEKQSKEVLILAGIYKDRDIKTVKAALADKSATELNQKDLATLKTASTGKTTPSGKSQGKKPKFFSSSSSVTKKINRDHSDEDKNESKKEKNKFNIKKDETTLLDSDDS